MYRMKMNILIILSFVTNLAYTQTHVNKEWDTTSGSPLGLDWTGSITSSNNQLISVGNSVINGQGANVLTTKYTKDGSIAWQRNFNTSGFKNDFGIGLTEDSAGNIYVVGTTDNNTTTNYDVVILKYNSLGVLLWNNTYNAFGKNDIGTAIKVDNTGNVYVVASSEGNTTNSDYLLLKYNSTGILQWDKRYDFASLTEIPLSVDFDAAGNVFVTGASASSIANWDYTIARYNAAGVFLGDERNASPGIGFDQPMDYKKDANGNIYITGRSSVNGVNYDIKTIKLNSNFVFQWSKLIDFAGKEDVGNSIDVDDSGNVYIGGFTTKSNNIKEAIAVKYDATGKEIWRHEQSSTITSGDALIESVDVTPSGELYFVGVEKGKNGTKDLMVSRIDTSGTLRWQKKLDTDIDEKPSDVNVADDGSIYVTALKDGAVDTYETVKYTEAESTPEVFYNANNEPVYIKNQLMVRFQRSALQVDAINSSAERDIDYADLDFFLTPDALDKFNNALSLLCSPQKQATTTLQSVSNPCNIKASRVFRELKTTDTTTISRLGDTIPIPDFWTTLLLEFPSGMDIEQVAPALDSIPDVVRYSEHNYIIRELGGACNDPLYAQFQHSLHKTNKLIFAGSDINVEPAWAIVTGGGSRKVRCGVFDGGIKWRHEDLGYSGVDPNTSVLVDGYLVKEGIHMKNVGNPDDDGHGTACAGIINAVRNNNIGISGIAGGIDCGTLNKGLSLYGIKILYYNTPLLNTMDYAQKSIVMTAIDDPKKDFAFGLNLSSHSWAATYSSSVYNTNKENKLLREAVHFSNRAKVTLCAARGNEGKDNLKVPAIIDDDWVINVGGTGNNGRFIHSVTNVPGFNDIVINGTFTASFGHDVDIAGPASEDITITTDLTGFSGFGGTSSATPHVAGVVGLMMSYLNDTIPSYQNLAPEDCENIIQLTAQDDIIIPGPDQFTGFGRLNAGAALKLIEKPNNAVKHFGTKFNLNSISQSQVSTGVIVNLKESYQNDAKVNFPAGQYIVNKYKVDAMVSHTLNTGDNIVSFWARPSSSTVLEDIKGSDLLPRERVKINTCTPTSCSMTGYVYEVFDRLSNEPLGWWPFDIASVLNKAKFEYTILTRKNSATSIQEQPISENNISIYPNPSTNQNTIIFTTTNEVEAVKIDMYDIQGRMINEVYHDKPIIGLNTINSNINMLPNGIYIYKIQIGKNIEHIKFVKQ